MSTDWSFTREKLRDAVLRKLGVLGQGRVASADDDAIFFETLDAALKELHVLGDLWWNIDGAPTDLTMTATNATVAGPTDMVYPSSLKVRVNGTDYDVDIVTHGRFQEIKQKTNAGRPTKAYLSGTTFYLWPVPDITYTGKLTYYKKPDNSAADTQPDVPVWAFNSLVDILKYKLIDDYAVPATKVSRFAMEAGLAGKKIRIMNAPKLSITPVEADYF